MFLPGVSFDLDKAGDYTPTLFNVRRLGVVCTYGGKRLTTLLAGDPPRSFIKRTLKFTCAPGTRVDYLALYDMDHATPGRRKAFLRKVEARFSQW